MTMKSTAQATRKALLAKVHIARKELALNEETYRAMLVSVTGHNSAADLNAQQLEAVLKSLKAAGFKPKAAKKFGKRPNVAAGKEVLLSKIEALLADAKRPWSYADAMAQRMFKVEKLSWLDEMQLRKLMQALIIDAKRNGSTY